MFPLKAPKSPTLQYTTDFHVRLIKRLSPDLGDSQGAIRMEYRV